MSLFADLSFGQYVTLALVSFAFVVMWAGKQAASSPTAQKAGANWLKNLFK